MKREPKRTKYRKYMKRSRSNKTFRGTRISFCEYGICSKDMGYICYRQIEAARIVLNKILRKRGKIVIRIFPDKVITKKPIEVRMGNGKGDIEGFVFKLTPGRIIFELDGENEEIIRRACKLSSAKLPVRTILVKRKYAE
ncbi:50S ribosomal protein L16 [Candidatus Vidania fulgoroideorum]